MWPNIVNRRSSVLRHASYLVVGMDTIWVIYSGVTLPRAMEMLVRGIDYVVDHVDDMCVHTSAWDNHVRTPRKLIRRLQHVNFTVRLTKFVLCATTIDVLCHWFGDGAISL
ncbi:Zinc finger protein [Plakobranchus ocellatus]|uniref:Zinc finger protein n=1 Tax=Plakobranchus ocellatus TaxID=259542 RepID=A0AAV3YM81_9GAST|nr:Zinc finger protein [Plakobranchus ocellatus]